MTAETFAGTELAGRIRAAAARDALGHAVILSGEGDRTAAARYLAAAMECTQPGRPCLRCPPCRKVLRDIHPDVVTVSDPEHKNISADVLRALRADAYIRPNEGARKVCVLEGADRMNAPAQNAMLKLLEEGPLYAAFLLIAGNAGGLLQTVRSRCEELTLLPDGEREDTGLELVKRLADALEHAGELELLEAAMTLEGKREELSLFLSALESELGSRAARGGERRRLLRAAELVKQLRGAAQLNVNAGQLAGWLCAGMFHTV